MNVYLVDGTYELFRSFYAGPGSANRAGREVGATRGLMRSMLALLSEPAVTHIACAFDHVIESFRNQLFAGYKTGEGIDPALYGQFELVERATSALGICTWPMVEFEADDAIATFAVRAAARPEVRQVVICSPDKDFAQCITGTRVVLLDRMRKRWIDEPAAIEKWGVAPESIPDWLALVGDTADGIPGIERWGARSAAAVLARYRHLEQIPQDAARWEVPVRGAGALALTLNAAREAVMLYRKLATLRRDVPLTEQLADIAWRGPNLALLQPLAEELDDDKIVELAQRTAQTRGLS